MTYTAYLVGFIDTRANPPRLKGAGIFSEPTPTVEGFPFTILETKAPTYEQAERLLKDYMEHPAYK